MNRIPGYNWSMESQTHERISRIGQKESSGFYLLIALSGIVLASLSNFLRPMSPVFKGQGLEVLIPFLFLAPAVIIWIRYVPSFDWDRKTKIFLLLVIGYWLCSFSLDSIQGDAVNYTTFILPIVIGMVYLKPLNTRTMFSTIDGFALLIIVISIVGQIAVGLEPMQKGLMKFETYESISGKAQGQLKEISCY
jgi:hypothetical protein